MKSLEEIKNFAEKKYFQVIDSVFNQVKIFPLVYDRFGKMDKSKLQKNFEQNQIEIKELIENSKKFNFEIIWEETNNRKIGVTKIPKSIQFIDLKFYLKFIQKESEFQILEEDFEKLISIFPELQLWLRVNIKELIPISSSLDKIISILSFFKNHPKPNLYIRELPIEGVDTKFIESNQKNLILLLDQILLKEYINENETNFEKRYYLKSKAILIRFRILDKTLNQNFPKEIFDLSIPIEEFQKLNFREETVFITENLINFLAFPKLKNSILILGGGYASSNLKYLKNISEKKIYYWGDMDSHGFQILSNLRFFFPQTQSIFMDKICYEMFQHLATNDNQKISSLPENLNSDEEKLFNYINSIEKANQLEQEKIPFEYVIEVLKNLNKF